MPVSTWKNASHLVELIYDKDSFHVMSYVREQPVRERKETQLWSSGLSTADQKVRPSCAIKEKARRHFFQLSGV